MITIITLVDLVDLCSNNSATGVGVDELQRILAATRDSAATSVEGRERRKWMRLSESAKNEVVTRYEAGESSPELATAFSVAKSTILGVLRERNVVVRRQPMTSEQVATARELYEAGCSLSQVSAQMDIPQDTIRLALKAAGVPLRPATGR